MNSVKLFIIPFIFIFLGGCSAIPGLKGTFENRLSCTIAGDRAYLNSEYGPISIGTKIAEIDSAALCGSRLTR